MPDTPPRLNPTAPSQTGYAPISWTAVASLGVGGLYLLVLAVAAYFALRQKQPLIEPLLLLFPAVAIVLAFTARRQIANSEGTRTGLGLANVGWWLGVLSGFGYLAYLVGVDVAVGSDAKRELAAFTDFVKKVDLTDPKDPNTYEACFRTLSPTERGLVRNRPDPATMDQVVRDAVIKFRQLDIVRIANRNRGSCDFSEVGVRDWRQNGTKVSCTLTCKLTAAEGSFSAAFPMTATIESGTRLWQIEARPKGFIQSLALTRYGYLIAVIDDSARRYAKEFVKSLSVPLAQPLAYESFVKLPGKAGMFPYEYGERFYAATAAGTATFVPSPKPGYADALQGGLFSLPFGGKPTSADREKFLYAWNTNQYSFPPETSVEEQPDMNPILLLRPDAVELQHPLELKLPGGEGTARGKLILQTNQASLLEELAKAREENGPPLTQAQQLTLPFIPWQVIRIESDLKPVAGAGGPPPG